MNSSFIIKLEYSLKLTNKAQRVRKQPIIALYFEFEIELKFYNLMPRTRLQRSQQHQGWPLRRWRPVWRHVMFSGE